MSDPFANLQRNHYGAILVDPPWQFEAWSEKGDDRSASQHYDVMGVQQMVRLPILDLAAKDCVLFCWSTWPHLKSALWLVSAWGFTYKTSAFDWMKANTQQIDIFREDADASMGMGYWTRSNTEPCLLATRGKPKRLDAGVRQGIIEPRREHSRKPDCVHDRIQRLVAGPYLELFARQSREGWDTWGNQREKFNAA